MPKRVQASTSMWGYTLRWLIRRRFGNRSSSGVRIVGAFTNEYQRFGVVETVGELVDILHVIGEDRYLVAVQPLEALQRAQRVEVVVEDCDPHASSFHDAALPSPT